MEGVEYGEAREELRQWMVKWTGCELQGPNYSWPCSTCTFELLKQLGLSEDGQHNDPVNRMNEVWRGIIQIRGQ